MNTHHTHKYVAKVTDAIHAVNNMSTVGYCDTETECLLITLYVDVVLDRTCYFTDQCITFLTDLCANKNKNTSALLPCNTFTDLVARSQVKWNLQLSVVNTM